jgi:hypothetical protein
MGLPERIGRYRILDKLGEGAMGTVYRGRDESLDRDVALKVMSRGMAEPTARARFLREARAAAKLQHPNIIVIYELGEHEGALYMALELLEGIDLQRGIGAGVKPDPRFTLPVVLQLLAGLGHAHEHGCIHRDVKPSNVFLPLGLPAKIMDFGVARLAGHAVTTTSGAVSGTPSYMSPEQIRGGEIDGRSDLFSTGLILYELVTGEKAFRADTVVAVVFKILHEDADLSLIPEGSRWDRLRRVIARALARPREERYPDARAMHEDLALALQDLGGSVDPGAPADHALLVRPRVRKPPVPASPREQAPRRPSPPRAAAPEGRRSRVALALAGALGVGTLGLLGFAAWLTFGPVGGMGAGPSPPAPRPSAPGPSEPGPSAPGVLPQETPAPVDRSTTPGGAGAKASEAQAGGTASGTATPSPAPTPTPPPAPTPTAPPTPALTLEQHLERANDAMAQGHFSLALAEARAVLHENPTHAEATAIAQDAEAAIVVEQCIDNARAALEAGDRERALAEIRRGLVIYPNDARLIALFKEATRE